MLTSEILAKEMEYLHCLLLYNYPQWMIKEMQKKPSTPKINPETCLEIKKSVCMSAPYIPGLSKEFKGIFHYTGVHMISKGKNTVKSNQMHIKGQILITS